MHCVILSSDWSFLYLKDVDKTLKTYVGLVFSAETKDTNLMCRREDNVGKRQMVIEVNMKRKMTSELTFSGFLTFKLFHRNCKSANQIWSVHIRGIGTVSGTLQCIRRIVLDSAKKDSINCPEHL